MLGFTALALSLPITITGLGVRDSVLIWMLATFGFTVNGEKIALSTCLLGMSLFWAFVVNDDLFPAAWFLCVVLHICLFWAFAGGVAFFWPTADT